MLGLYGWTEARASDFTPYAGAGLVPGRIIAQHRDRYALASAGGELTGEISGRLAREAPPGGYPTAGDWVAFRAGGVGGPAVIEQVLPRTSAFQRTAPGGHLQVIAANMETAFLVASLDADLNPRRLERYLAAALSSGARPVILLTKADLLPDAHDRAADIQAMAGEAPVIVLSAKTGAGLGALAPYLQPGRTAVMVGSSGAGKSTLANALLGATRMAVGEIRQADDKGRHTTSHRELLLLPGGGLLLDTPGLRELALWDGQDGVIAAFEDVEVLAAECRFRDCGHTNEPGCAVRAALANGALGADRWQGFQKLRRETAHQARAEDPVLSAAERRKWVQITKAQKARYKHRDRT